MRKFRFREFQIYKDARKIRLEIRQLSERTFPKEEKFRLTDQLWRALDSIILNIAEGCERGTDKDFAHFLNNAHTSLNEIVACLDLALDGSYLDSEIHEALLRKSESLANQITAFRLKLLKDPSK